LKKEIEKIAWVFHRTLREMPKDGAEAAFRHFPLGSCGAATEMLAFYILNTIQVRCEKVCGIRSIKIEGSEEYKINSHAWLDCCGLIVDITATQFEDYRGKEVFVDQNSAWHDEWSIDSKIEFDLGSLGGWAGDWANAYRLCEQKLANSR
jgi:hypothetical protein